MAVRARTGQESLVDALREIVGDRGLLTGEDAAARSCDPFRHVPPATPVIVRPGSTEEVAAVMALCHRRGQRVVTHGGRTGVAGGAYAGPQEIVLSLERMAAVEEIDPVGQWIAVGAGMTVEAVQEAVAAHDLLYPIDLGAKGTATSAKKSTRATAETAKRAATTTGRTARSAAKRTVATAKRTAA